MIVLNEDEITILERTIETAPLRNQFHIAHFISCTNGDEKLANKIKGYCEENDLFGLGNYDSLTDNGRKFKKLKTFTKYKRWRKQEDLILGFSNFGARFWIIPVIIAAGLSALFTVKLESCSKNEIPTIQKQPLIKQIKDSTPTINPKPTNKLNLSKDS